MKVFLIEERKPLSNQGDPSRTWHYQHNRYLKNAYTNKAVAQKIIADLAAWQGKRPGPRSDPASWTIWKESCPIQDEVQDHHFYSYRVIEHPLFIRKLEDV